MKATFSVLARRCDTPERLIEHLRFAAPRHEVAGLAPLAGALAGA